MIAIRKAKRGDREQLEELFLITRRATFHWESPDSFFLSDFSRLTCGEAVFVAETQPHKIVGMISVWENEQPPFIHNLFVLPEHQGRGIGKLLINHLASQGILPPYELRCVAKNEKALNFYLKNGWTETGRGTGEEGEFIQLTTDRF